MATPSGNLADTLIANIVRLSAGLEADKKAAIVNHLDGYNVKGTIRQDIAAEIAPAEVTKYVGYLQAVNFQSGEAKSALQKLKTAFRIEITK